MSAADAQGARWFTTLVLDEEKAANLHDVVTLNH